MSALGDVFGGSVVGFKLVYDEDMVVYNIKHEDSTGVHGLGAQPDAATARTAMDTWMSANGGWIRVTYWLHNANYDSDTWHTAYVQTKDGVVEVQ